MRQWVLSFPYPLRLLFASKRIATGKHAGRKVVTLQALPGEAGPLEGDAGKVGGFPLHAGIAAEAHESPKIERLCRYIARPAISVNCRAKTPRRRLRTRRLSRRLHE